MNAKIRKQLAARKRKIEKRLDKTKMGEECPVLSASNIHYEIADRAQAVAVGGVGMIQLMVKRLKLEQAINRHVNRLKLYAPYSESDHVLNIAYNALAGGTCLEHLELLRNNEAYLDALGSAADSRPDHGGRLLPAVRPLVDLHVDGGLQRDAASRSGVSSRTRSSRKPSSTPTGRWSRRRANASRAWTSITKGCGGIIRCWSRWPTRANRCTSPIAAATARATRGRRPVSRSGRRFVPPRGLSPDHAARRHRLHADGAPGPLGCRRRAVRVRHRRDVEPLRTRRKSAGKRLAAARIVRPEVRSQDVAASAAGKREGQHRSVERQFETIRLRGEYVAEFSYRPTKCNKDYRVVVVWKDLEITKGQLKLFDDSKCFFYITNDWDRPAAEIVRSRQPSLRSGELDRAAEERRARAEGAAGQFGEQLGLHDDHLVGLEPEGLGRAVACRPRPLERQHTRRRSESCCGWTSPRSATPSSMFRRRSSARAARSCSACSPGIVGCPRSSDCLINSSCRCTVDASARSRSPDAPVRRHPQRRTAESNPTMKHRQPDQHSAPRGAAPAAPPARRENLAKSQRRLRLFKV